MAGIPHLRPTEASLREVRQALQQVELALSSTPLHNWTATSDPTAGDDLRDGYGQGSWWYRTDTEGLWICTDASPGNAVWDDTVGSTILGAATAFKTINCPAGTDPVSEVAADTLHLYSGHAGLTITGDSSADSVTYNLVEGSIDHDSLQNFVGDKHVAHSGVTLTAGAGLTGGGTIAANRTFDLDVSDLDAIAVPAAADQLAIYDDGVGQKKITFANLESNISHDAIADVSADDHHAEIHTIVSHDTTATGANLTTLTDGSDAAGLHTHGEDDIHDLGTTVLLHSLFDAHTILYATADNTPLALTVAENSVIGRKSGGNINALTEGTLTNPGGPAAGDYVLGWQSGVLVKWATTSLGPYVHPNHSGDVTSTGDGATVVAALQGETLTITAGAAGDYLRYSGAAWVDVASSQILTDIEASIDHTAITNIGATSHADIDTHIGIALTAAATIDQHQLIVGASDGTRQMAATQLEWTTYGAGAGGTYSGYFHMAGQIVLWLSTDTTPAQLDYAALLTGDGDATLLATGSSANVNLLLQAKGSGVVTANNDGTDREVATISGTQTLTNKTLTTPTIGDFTNATHDHENEAGGGTLAEAAIADLGTTVVLKSLFDAHTMLYATVDDTPAALTVAANSLVGRAAGNIDSLIYTDVTEEASPAALDWLLGWTADGSLRKYDIGNLPGGAGGGDVSWGAPAYDNGVIFGDSTDIMEHPAIKMQSATAMHFTDDTELRFGDGWTPDGDAIMDWKASPGAFVVGVNVSTGGTGAFVICDRVDVASVTPADKNLPYLRVFGLATTDYTDLYNDGGDAHLHWGATGTLYLDGGSVDIVGGSLTLTGTVDGVDVAALSSAYTTHAADTSDPHGASMTVSTKVGTPEIENASGDITIDAIDAADHSEVTVQNSNGTYYTGMRMQGTYGLDVYANGSLGATPTINWKKSNIQTGTLSANATITFTAPVRPGFYHLIITQGASPYTVTWPAAVKWVDGGTEPVQTTTASAIDLYHLLYDGTNYYGYHGPNHA